MEKRKGFQPILFAFMKITLSQILIMAVFTSLVSAATLNGQGLLDREITLDVQNKDIRTVLNTIQRKTSIRFTYQSRAINSSRRVSLSVSDSKLGDVLNELFSPDVRIIVVDETQEIILLPGMNAVTSGLDVPVVQNLITGTVLDEARAPLPGVNVLEKGTTNGTTTDVNGKFSLQVNDQNSVLVFSFIGYGTTEVPVGAQSDLSVILQPDAKTLEEIVVVGYGTVKKSDLTGAVSSVKSEELTAFPVAGISQALQGRAAGVNIQSNNGDPGGSFKVRIRGGTSINASSDPIYVVDGFVGGILPPPEDVESIEVLKDASATAIYGSRGANGVIMVTTKKGKAGRTRIEVNSSFTSQEAINRLDLLNAEQFVDYTQEILPDYVPAGADTDWQDQIFRTGGIQNYQLSFSGGNDGIRYYLSSAYYDQEGIVLGSSFNRVSATSNLEFDASKKLKIGLNLFAQRTGRDGVRTQEVSGGANEAGVVASSFRFMPDVPVYRPDGSFTTAVIGDPIDNPFAIATQRQEETIGDRFQGNFYAQYDFTESLSFRTTFGGNTDNQRTGTFIPTTLNQGRNVGGQASINSFKNTTFINENYLTYTKTFSGDHALSVMAGYSFQKNENTSWGATSQSFITDAVSFWNLGGGAVVQPPNSAFSETQLSSYYARANYSFGDRYILTANARYDGSSNFSKNNKWAFFPSGAFAWNMKNEAFMQDVSAVSFWKWRVSYGLTGNQAISPYQTLARFSNVFTVLNGVPVNAVRPTSVANDDLTWETTAQLDIGADIGLFNDRVSVTLDYYRMVTSDLLFSVQLPQYSGYPNQLKNIGKVENKGLEFTISSDVLTGAFRWNASVNLSANRNKVLELPDGNDILYGSGPGHMIGLGTTQILREGYPVGSFFGWQYDGVYQEGDTFLPGGGFEQVAGGEKFRDIDGTKDAAGDLTGEPDGVLNGDDRTVIGNPQPKFFWGLNNDFSFRNFDLNIFIQGSSGNDILSYTLLELETLSGSINSTTRALDRWTPENTDTDVPKRTTGRPQRVSSRWIFDGSFVRVKNIALGYNFPRTVLDKISLQKLRVYVSAQNVLTFTDYRGYDPEVNYRSEGGADANRNLGLDYGSYPNAKSYTVGLNVGF